ncbi:MAG TPA: hypothetical protein VL283_03015 [Candidatus Baltobacteraceae bacterium]|nr:hypothetical protein [Candidatus Baltobacteraceae bacterium]
MTPAFHERIDVMTRRDRCKLYYAVGIVSSGISLRLGHLSYPAAFIMLGLVAAFLLVRFLRELRPDRMAMPPELRAVLRKPRSE